MALNLVDSKEIMMAYEAVLNDELNWYVFLLFLLPLILILRIGYCCIMLVAPYVFDLFKPVQCANHARFG